MRGSESVELALSKRVLITSNCGALDNYHRLVAFNGRLSIYKMIAVIERHLAHNLLQLSSTVFVARYTIFSFTSNQDAHL